MKLKKPFDLSANIIFYMFLLLLH